MSATPNYRAVPVVGRRRALPSFILFCNGVIAGVGSSANATLFASLATLLATLVADVKTLTTATGNAAGATRSPATLADRNTARIAVERDIANVRFALVVDHRGARKNDELFRSWRSAPGSDEVDGRVEVCDHGGSRARRRGGGIALRLLGRACRAAVSGVRFARRRAGVESSGRRRGPWTVSATLQGMGASFGRRRELVRRCCRSWASRSR